MVFFLSFFFSSLLFFLLIYSVLHPGLLLSAFTFWQDLERKTNNIQIYKMFHFVSETIEREMDKLLKAAHEVHSQRTVIQTKSVRQAIQAVCTLMGQIETFEISEALNGLSQLCDQLNASNFRSRTEIKSDEGDYSVVQVVNSKSHFENSILLHCDKIRDALRNLIEAYCNAFSVDYELRLTDDGYGGEFN